MYASTMKLALIAALSLAASNADADCAFSGLIAKPITVANTALPADGGIVIAALPDRTGKLDPGDPALDHAFVIKGVAKATARSLAPGLAVVPVPANTTELYDQVGKPVLAIKTTTDKPKLAPAPIVKKIEYTLGRRRGIEQVFVTIDKLPADALAIVLSDPKGKPKSWGLVSRTTGGRLLGFSSTSCQALPNGTVPSKEGDQVIVQLVDAYGRLSAPTRPLRITLVGP